MSLKSGQLLWNRQRLTFTAGETRVIDTGLTQLNQAFANSSANEPPLGVVSTTPPAPGTTPASRVHVIPESPTTPWLSVLHGEPFLNPTTGTVQVEFTNAGQAPVTINVLFWDPHTGVGPGQADTYNVFVPPIPP